MRHDAHLHHLQVQQLPRRNPPRLPHPIAKGKPIHSFLAQGPPSLPPGSRPPRNPPDHPQAPRILLDLHDRPHHLAGPLLPQQGPPRRHPGKGPRPHHVPAPAHPVQIRPTPRTPPAPPPPPAPQRPHYGKQIQIRLNPVCS